MNFYRVLSAAPKWQTYRDKPASNAPAKRRFDLRSDNLPTIDDVASSSTRPGGRKAAQTEARDQDQLIVLSIRLAAAS